LPKAHLIFEVQPALYCKILQPNFKIVGNLGTLFAYRELFIAPSAEMRLDSSLHSRLLICADIYNNMN